MAGILHNMQVNGFHREEDLEKLNEIVFFENRFDVIGKLRDPDDVFEILPKLQGCQAAIVSGIDATLRNGIVKSSLCLIVFMLAQLRWLMAIALCSS